MSQTISAFLALLIVSLVAVTQQRTAMHSYEGMLNGAMNVMASGAALQVLDFIERQAFDNATTGGSFVTSPSQLSNWPFTTGNACQFNGTTSPCDDVDDFHRMIPDTVKSILRGGNIFRFTITSDVFYVDTNLNPDSMVTYKTYAKMAIVEVMDVNGIMHTPAHISRLITCDASNGCY